MLCRDDVRSLKTRFGAGSSREIGGFQDDWPLELQWGLDWERKLGSKIRLFATNDYYPQFKDFARFRVNTRAGIETVLDPAYGLSLQTFVLNRYNSTPDPDSRLTILIMVFHSDSISSRSRRPTFLAWPERDPQQRQERRRGVVTP